jgi:hypothetical protein
MNTVVCWDFDETLGYFRPLEFGFFGMPAPSAIPPARLKPGIAALLDSLRDFTHVVTTAAVGEYARRVLRDHGLLKYFSVVLGREDGVCAGDGKDYGLVGKRFGIAEDDLRSRLVIVGNDAERDADCRCRQVVMIHDARMMDLPAAPLATVLRGLVREGDGDIKRGFDAYFDRSGGAPLVLQDDLKLKLEYWGSYAEKRVHPVVSTILPMC